MEKETKMSSEVHVVKGAPEDVKTVDVSVKDVKGEMTKEDKVMEKEEEDTIFDGGFIKVDKEGITTKDGEKAEKQVLTERNSSSSQRELLESQEKVKALELKLNQELDDLRAKVSEQQSINLKLREELKEKEMLHALSKDQEGIIRTVNEKLTKVLKDKEVLETSLAEISQNEAKTKETCDELEGKLKISDEKFSKTDALLSQALSNNSDLEQKLKSLEEEVSQLKSALVSEEEQKDSARQMQEYQEKVTESENLLRVLRSELDVTREKLESNENAMKAAGLRESEAMEKLRSAEERLEKQAREVYEANRRAIEMKDLHKHSDLSIQKAMEELNIIDNEAKSLTEKTKHLKERIRLYEDKLAEASAHSFSLKHELDQSSLENELLSDTNNQLKIKIQELEGFLDAEKETATERFNQRDTEAKDLATKLQSHENLIEEHKKKVLEVSEVADTRQMELGKALMKLKSYEDTIKELEKENESLAEVNLKLNQELANHGSETSGFQAMFSALEAEKDQTAKELQASKGAVEKLTNKLTSERERLRSQVTSLAEENKQVNEIYESTKNELINLQEQLGVEKSKLDAMASEIKKLTSVASEKSVLESKFDEVERQLKNAEAQLQEEKEAVSQKHSELEATQKKSQEELESKKSMIVHLESLLKVLEQKVQLADAKSKETETMGKGEVEVKSRDIDLSFSTPKQRKSKEESDTSSSGNVTTQKAETSHLMTLKIVLGVALVSVIIGIILGKKY